jgi:hypothetical protein
MKAGDKVWVMCEVAMVYRDRAALYMDIRHDGAVFEAKRSDCRPVEPELNSPKILGSSSEPMREAFEDWIAPNYDWDQSYFSRNENRYFDSSVEMAWQAFQAGVNYQPHQIDKPEQVKQFVIVTDQDGNQTLYVDGVLRNGDNTVYGCDVADAANGCAIKIELRDVDFIVEHWPLGLSDLGAEAKQPEPSPLAPSPCMDGVNVDQFIEGITEAREPDSDFQVGDAVRIKHDKDERLPLVVRSFRSSGSSNTPIALCVSECGKRIRWSALEELERIDKADPINPSHYKQGGIECIEAIKAATGEGFVGFVWGNVLKYLWRWPKKGGVDDLKKARWYLDRLIKEVSE